MQQEFDDEERPVQILGINQAGYEIGNQTITADRDIPWLQDTEDVDAWGLWEVTYRDVYLLDQSLTLRGIYNLSQNNLNEEATYAELKDIILGLLEE